LRSLRKTTIILKYKDTTRGTKGPRTNQKQRGVKKKKTQHTKPKKAKRKEKAKKRKKKKKKKRKNTKTQGLI